jgi:DNA-binding winged helix-turn-helix (wHTH) protein/TolB-like protein/Tfp pilus assembly protein PilF
VSLDLDLNYLENNFKVDKSSNNRVYQFEEFELDAVHLMLSRNDEEIPLAPKAVETLLVLVEQRGNILSKTELMDAIWTDSIVEESNLAQYLHILRKTLGEQQNGQPFIETLRRRGYRFNGDVTVSEGANRSSQLRQGDAEKIKNTFAESTRETRNPNQPGLRVERHGNVLAVADWKGSEKAFLPERDSDDANRQPVTPANYGAKPQNGFRSRRWLIALASVGILLIAAYGYYLRQETLKTVADAPIKSLAVLPFKPLDISTTDESFQLGLADSLITRFGGSEQLTVRPLSSVRRYTDLDQDAADIGRKLTTDAVLDGNYQRDGDRIRLTLRLLKSSDGSVLWADKFDERLVDMFSLQDAISYRVYSVLISRLADSKNYILASRGTDDEEAFQLYQRGRYFWNQRTFDGISRAIKCFEDAIERDPNFAQAYSGLADAYLFSGGPGLVDVIEKARKNAHRAVELNDRLAEPHASLGIIAINHDWDFATGERHLRQAIEINPNYATAHHWLGDVCLAQSGRFDEAIVELRRAQELDPLSPIINTDVGKAMYLARNYDEAIGQLRYALELEPSFGIAHMWLSLAYMEKGDYPAAMAEAGQARYGNEFISKAMYLLIDAYAGRKSEARAGLTKLLRDTDKRVLSGNGGWIAYIYARIGENDKAFEWLGKEFEVRGVAIVGLKTIPVWDPIRSDPRFNANLKRAGF